MIMQEERKSHYLNIVCIQNGPVEGNAFIVWDESHPESGSSYSSFFSYYSDFN